MTFVPIAVWSTLVLGSVAVAAPPAFHTQVAAGNPLLWFKLSEDAPGIFVNSGSLGVAYNADIPAGAATGVPTIGGDTGVRFNGSAAQFLITDAVAPASLTGDPTFSCETIVRVDANTSTQFGYSPFLHWGGATTGRSVYFSLHLFSGAKPYVGFYNGGLRAVCDQPLSRFVHIVWTHQGGGGQWGGSTLYINGRVVPTEHDTVLIGAPTINVTATQFRINAATDGARQFSGVMDEIVLYDHVLTATEVTAHYNTLTIPRCIADLANLGGSAACGADGAITADDLIAFLSAFFDGNLAVADVASLGGSPQPDGTLTPDDLITYLAAFFAGCG